MFLSLGETGRLGFVLVLDYFSHMFNPCRFESSDWVCGGGGEEKRIDAALRTQRCNRSLCSHTFYCVCGGVACGTLCTVDTYSTQIPLFLHAFYSLASLNKIKGFTAVENLHDYIFPIKFIILECKGQ